MFRDLKQALRALLRQPLLAVTVIATLAVGLGAAAALFSVVDAVLLRPLPYDDAERLALLWETVERDSVERRAFSFPDFLDLYRHVEASEDSAIEGLAAWDDANVVVRTAAGEGLERLQSVLVTPEFFSVLGATPVVGVGLGGRATDPRDAGDPEVVVSHRLWRERLGGDRTVLGRTLEIEGEPHRVVGVMPRGWQPLADDAELWLSILDLGTDQDFLDNRGARWHRGVARLRGGSGEDLTVAEARDLARRELDTVFSRLAEEYPDSNAGYSADLGDLQGELVGDLRAPVLVLFAAVGLLWLLVLSNVASLLLVRASQRARETAVRVALGAGRVDLLRARLAETSILVALSAALGLVIALTATHALIVLSPVTLPGVASVEVGARVVGFLVGLAGVTIALLVVMVGLRSRRLLEVVGASSPAGRSDDVSEHLRSGGAAAFGLRQALLLGQVALATLLLVGAGLLLATFRQLSRVDPGYATERVALLRVGLPAPSGLDEEAEDADERRDALLAAQRHRLLDALQAVPGVESAALTFDTPLQGGYAAMVVSAEGAERVVDDPYEGGTRVYRHLVTPGYFETLDIPILRGRTFDSGDDLDSQGVAVVSATLAERLWPDQEALGRRFQFGAPARADEDLGESEWVTVVGVVPDVRQRGLVPRADGAPEDPDVYYAMDQFSVQSAQAAVRTRADPVALFSSLRTAAEGVAADVVVYGLETMGDRIARATSRERFAGTLLGFFAGIALLLVALGIYGNVAFQVATGRRDIGIRLALGADAGRVVREVVRRGATRVAAGAAIGLVAALVLSRFVESQLYGVERLDLRFYVLAGVLVLALGGLAAWLPARRAARVDPVSVLRAD